MNCKRFSKLIRSIAFMLLFATAALSIAATLLDASKQTIPASFYTKAKQARNDFNAKKLIAAPFSPTSAITKEILATLTLVELDALEESLFPDNTNWYDKDYNYMIGKLSTKGLAADKVGAVELIRAQRKEAEKMLPVLKNNTSIDLDFDGKKEKVTYATSKENYVTLTVGAAKKTFSGSSVEAVYTADLSDKQKLLFIDVGHENDYILTYILIYKNGNFTVVENQNKKSAEEISVMTGRFRMRYLGNGDLYSETINMPVTVVEKYKITEKGYKFVENRSQHVIMPVKLYGKDSGSDVTYDIKCKNLDGGTITFKAGAQLTVLTSTPFEQTGGTSKKEAYIALMSKSGKVGLVMSDDYGYSVAKTETPFMDAFSGFYYMP